MTPRKRKRRRPRPSDEAAYICPTCGESIVTPVDLSAGTEHQYTEDCPLCCHPNLIRVEFFRQREPPRFSAEAE